MFYCDPCRLKRGWPMSFSKSKGPCEECGETTICHDVPSKQVPLVDARNKKAQDLHLPMGWNAYEFAATLRLEPPYPGVAFEIPKPQEPWPVERWREECRKEIIKR